MIPLRDTQRARTLPLVTVGLIALNLLVFFEQLRAGPLAERLILAYGLVPARLVHWSELGGPPGVARFLPLLTSQFLHGGWLHLLGNLLYLWVFGDNVEDRLGHLKFLLFYLACGVVAGLAQVWMDPSSPIPTVGASGAIAGVLGAYLVSYPRARVLTFVPIFFLPWLVEVPAFVFLILWFASQVLMGLTRYGRELTGGVAWWAHVGGFVAGALLVNLGSARGRRRG
jgi:membrane associated rhomboid family serine protease